MIDFIRLTMPDTSPIVVPTKDVARVTPRITTGSYVQCYKQEDFSVLETPAEIGEILGAACAAPTAVVVVVEKPVKGEDEAWSAWVNNEGEYLLSKEGKNTQDEFRAALRIAIAANQQPMHFTIDDIVRIANASNKSVVAYLRSMGATVEYP